MLFLPQPFQKPDQHAKVRWDHPAAQGLRLYFPLNEGVVGTADGLFPPVERVTGIPLALTNADGLPFWVSTSEGMGLRGTNPGYNADNHGWWLSRTAGIPFRLPATSVGYTIGVRTSSWYGLYQSGSGFRFEDNLNASLGFRHSYHADTHGPASAIAFSAFGGSPTATETLLCLDTDGTQTMFITIDKTAQRVYHGGKLYAETSASRDVTVDGGRVMHLYLAAQPAGAYWWETPIMWLGLWNRILDTDTMRFLTTHPYALMTR